jgi:5-methylcytosine-specific restriction endonuclease McrA
MPTTLRRKKPNSPAAKAWKKVKLQSLQRVKERADRALQDWYRAKYAGRMCEAECGSPFQVMHHYVPKSQSAGLRFEHENLVFLCHGCHFRHHRTGDPDVMGTVIGRRGIKWTVALRTIRNARKDWTLSRKFLEEQLTKYQ